MHFDYLRAVRKHCLSLEASYQRQQEALLVEGGGCEPFPARSGMLAAYGLASGVVSRLLDDTLACRHLESEERALSHLLAGLTRELLFLGSALRLADDLPMLLLEKQSDDLRRYHRSQGGVLAGVLSDLSTLLAPGLVACVLRALGPEQVQALDAQSSWGEVTRRRAVALVCRQLAEENRLDGTYAAIAEALADIDFPRDIHSDEDRYRRCALPAFVRRLLVADVAAFIAALKAEFFAAALPWEITLSDCQGPAQLLLERRAKEVPVPQLSMRATVFPGTQVRLGEVGIIGRHEEPCLLCSTHGGHCDYWQITFPEGTDFGEAEQTEHDRREHAYDFTPRLPVPLPAGLVVCLSYHGIWQPDRPWVLLLLDLDTIAKDALG